jgi:hypothetical protein
MLQAFFESGHVSNSECCLIGLPGLLKRIICSLFSGPVTDHVHSHFDVVYIRTAFGDKLFLLFIPLFFIGLWRKQTE